MSGDDVEETPTDGSEAMDGFDDDAWVDDDPAPRPGVSPLAMVLGAVAVLALITVLIVTSGSSSDSKDGAAKVDGTSTTTTIERGRAWPAIVQGRPAVFGATGDPISGVAADAEPGVYVWTDYDGWHAWVVDPTGKAAASGTLLSNQAFKSASVAVPDQGKATVADNTVPFDLSGVDAKAAGINFDLGFYADELTVTLGGTDLPLFLGPEAKSSPLPAVISKAVPSN